MAQRPTRGSRRSYRREDPEKRRRDLIEATFRCLDRDGLAGTGVRAIAQEAGVSIGLIRHHFQDKDQLIAATYRFVADQLYLRSSQAAEAAGGTPWDRLRAFLVAGNLPPFLERSYIRVRFMLWGAAITDPVIRAAHDATYQRYRLALRDLIAAVRELPAGHPDAESLSRSLLAFLDGLWIDWLLDPDQSQVEASIDLCLQAIHKPQDP